MCRYCHDSVIMSDSNDGYHHIFDDDDDADDDDDDDDDLLGYELSSCHSVTVHG